MNILLLGEFSSLHKNLSEGLVKLGHDVLTVSSGDGWKKINSDIVFDSPLPGRLGGLHRHVVSPLVNRKKLVGFDIVQFICPFVFLNFMGFNNKFVRHIIKNNERSFLSAPGGDAFYWQNQAGLRYSPLDDHKRYDLKIKKHFLESEKALEWNTELARNVNGIIPIMHEYSRVYQDFPNLKKSIPIPVNTDKIVFKENKYKNKLVVLHGLSREGFKGTRHVREAFARLEKKYPNDLELILAGNLPLAEYLKLMERANVIVDQTYSYSCGVNAVFALAQGKIVLGGAEPESLQEFGLSSSPVINILPDAVDIERKIENLLDNKNRLEELGNRSRLFSEEVHHYVKVAESYVNVWENS